MNPKVSIIMGSTSDLPIMEQAAKLFDEFEIPFEINALSAHRTPDQAMDFARNAADRGIRVIIAGAGGAAHLPGVVAALTPLPVIGVPIKASISIDGWDSILSILHTRDAFFCQNLERTGSAHSKRLLYERFADRPAHMNEIYCYKMPIFHQIVFQYCSALRCNGI